MRHSSLREYQENLAARLNTAKAADASESKLGMMVDADLWLMDLADVGEVIPVPELLAVPLTKHWFAGVANIRGNLYSIVDFAAFMGGPAVPRNDQARLLLIAERHRIRSALLVNRVVGLRRADQFHIQDDGEPLAPWELSRHVDTDNRKWRALDVDSLIRHPGFLQVEA
jgi:twitching motility protein PilI